MSSKDLDALKEAKVDIYNLLEVPSTATPISIRKAYRQQALIYHPDKNSSTEAAEKFHFLTLALNVLNDKSLKAEYDAWQKSRRLEKERVESLGQERRRMKEELERAEMESAGVNHTWGKRRGTSKDVSALEIERLRKEGAMKRRKFEEEYLGKLRDQNQARGVKDDEHIANGKSDRTVRVKWKAKEGIADLFTSDVLEGMMSYFGEVEYCQMLERKLGSRYNSALVVFGSVNSADNAIRHDYSSKSNLWEETPYRKLSSLLREVKGNGRREVSSKDTLRKEDMSFEDYLDKTLAKLRKLEQAH